MDNLRVGACSWNHDHWSGTFYPDDLPTDWRLGYYCNQFNTVLVPAQDWQAGSEEMCASWADDIDEGFRFYIEVPERVLADTGEVLHFRQQLAPIRPQVAALVVDLVKLQPRVRDRELQERLTLLEEQFELLSFQSVPGGNIQPLWQPGVVSHSSLAVITSELDDFRQIRVFIEQFIQQSKDPAAVIIRHPALRASDLLKLRQVTEIMGL